MPTYCYRARDMAGKLVAGTLTEGHEQAARDHLRRQNLFVIQLTARGGRRSSGFTSPRRLRVADMVLFCRHFAGLLEAGIPIRQALESLVEQTVHPVLREAADAVRREILGGATLSAAMKEWPRVFPEVLISLVVAGETGGNLAECLDAAATQFEREQELREQVGSAFIYPAIVLGATVLVVTLMLFFVVPIFARVYESMNATLPALTRLLIVVSAGLTRYTPIVAAVVAAAVYTIRAYCSTEKGRYRLDCMKLRLPIFGSLNRNVALARFVRTLAAMIESGVPITRGLETAAVVAGNRVITHAVRTVLTEVMRGATLSTQLANTGEFPPMVTRLVAAGETSGSLERMLGQAARLYDRDVEYTVKRLTTALEPVLTLCLSVIVGLVVLALYLPIFSLVRQR